MIRKALLLSVLLPLVSCQSFMNVSRDPASSLRGDERLAVFYQMKMKVSQIEDQLKDVKARLNPHSQDPQLFPVPMQATDTELLVAEKQALENQVVETTRVLEPLGASSKPARVEVPFEERWRRHHDEFILHELKPYALKNGQIQRKMYLSTDTTKAFYLQLTNYTASWKKSRSEIDSNRYLDAELTCDREVYLHLKPFKSRVQAKKPFGFKWYDWKVHPQRPLVEIRDPETVCDLTFHENTPEHRSGIRFFPESQELARIGNPHLKGEVCYLPNATGLDLMDQYFLSPNLYYTTCPVKLDQWETLELSTEGINAKIRALTGKSLSDEYMKKGDPFAPLGFSEAPKLDAILISYLVFRADFGGTVIMQALRHHARRGTLIRIALSDVITLGKDRQMLLDFQSEFPNVKLLFYKYRSQGKGFKDWVSSFHRTNHIKLFLTYSQSDESANKVILGGRNIHDGFVFEQPTANYIYPTIVDYSADGDESWARWEDFETLFTSKDLVQTIMGQFFSVLHADYLTVHFRSYTEPLPTTRALDPQYLRLQDNEIYIRSLVSIPFKDNMALERAFIQMIDSAQRVIKVSTPYFNLTEGLLEAFARAAARGVDVQLITRLDLKGDTADIILSDVNKKSVNKLYDRIKIYEYTTQGKILHSKLFLIDDKFVMMGSVNLNLRSFYHDIENATLVYGPSFNRKIDQIYEMYKKESRLLTEKQKTTFWKILLIRIIGTAL
ncbi:MAG: phospholipase D-like domain-containing protein [Bdellovibrionales bacterium]